MEHDSLPPDVRESLKRSLAAGPEVQEPKVRSRVQAALEAAGASSGAVKEPPLIGTRVVLFLDLDGCTHAQGDSRIDDQGKLVGEGLFRWWPQLKAVLDEHPDVDVVIHSSWGRLFGPLQFLKPLLPPDLAARVSDITDMDEPRRGHAVQSWVDAHVNELGAYVVLDDQGDCFAPHVPLVLCDSKRGLSDRATVESLRQALCAAKIRARWRQ